MPNVERLKELIEQARKAHDEPTVKALGEKLYEATGVYEPEFAPVESSGDPKLDHLRKVLILAIAARDEATVATLREKIKEIEGEPLPEVNIELTEEPIAPPEVLAELEAELSPFVAADYEDDTISREELEAQLEYTEEEEELLDPDVEEVLVADMLKDKLMGTQIAALGKMGIITEEDLRQHLPVEGDKIAVLCEIKGIGITSANVILETLGYEA